MNTAAAKQQDREIEGKTRLSNSKSKKVFPHRRSQRVRKPPVEIPNRPSKINMRSSKIAKSQSNDCVAREINNRKSKRIGVSKSRNKLLNTQKKLKKTNTLFRDYQLYWKK